MASSMQIEFNKAAIVRNKKLHGAGYVMQKKKKKKKKTGGGGVNKRKKKKDTKIGYIPSYMRGYISFYLSFSSIALEKSTADSLPYPHSVCFPRY